MKNVEFEKNKFEHILHSDPTWFISLADFLKEFFYEYDGDETAKTSEWLQTRAEFVGLVEKMLDSNTINIASTGPNIDQERKEIDTIVIHHSATKKPKDFTLAHINALSLIRIFAPVHANPKYSEYKKPIWSNHFYEAKQTFVVYHYLIWPDGSIKHVLNDNAIGWQAGNWDVNCRSVAICFMGDYRKVPPTTKSLLKAQQIIKKYPNVKILSHRDVNKTTTCPGDPYFGENGWHTALIPARY